MAATSMAGRGEACRQKERRISCRHSALRLLVDENSPGMKINSTLRYEYLTTAMALLLHPGA